MKPGFLCRSVCLGWDYPQCCTLPNVLLFKDWMVFHCKYTSHLNHSSVNGPFVLSPQLGSPMLFVPFSSLMIHVISYLRPIAHAVPLAQNSSSCHIYHHFQQWTSSHASGLSLQVTCSKKCFTHVNWVFGDEWNLLRQRIKGREFYTRSSMCKILVI